MLCNDLALQTLFLGRFAFRFNSETVKTLIPNDVLGVYLLLLEGESVYVGRSDTCLRTRLAYHPHLRHASHFTYEICRSAYRAFYLESYWFHRLQRDAPQQFLNCIHPAKPQNFSRHCPFCIPNDSKAFEHVLSKLGILEQNTEL